MPIRSKLVAACCAVLLQATFAFSQKAPAKGLVHFTLDNGLEVFFVENHMVPLARVQITFRTGGVSQSPQTAGLFHLYEHMLFKGNRAYPTEASFHDAMKELGVANWNGGTSLEYVRYFFTVLSDKVDQGIAFWANAVRYPLFDPTALEAEKKVVVNEVLGNIDNPGNIFESAINERLFSSFPWRKDVSGSEALVSGATERDLRAIEDRWYVPNNAALFIGGDVDPASVRASVQKYFGTWRRAADPWVPPPAQHPALPRDALLVYPNTQMSAGLVAVALRFRGPDVMRDPAATYAADVWLKLLDDPNGRFKSDVFKNAPGMGKKEYLWVDYTTRRDGGYIGFSTYMLPSQAEGTFARALGLKKAIAEELALMASDSAYFSENDFSVLEQKLGDDQVLGSETAGEIVNALSFWWATADSNYYFGYGDALQGVRKQAIARFLSTYLLERTSVLAMRMNPKDFEAEKSTAEGTGWTVIDKGNAYWWESAPGGASK
jgi:zinc protease